MINIYSINIWKINLSNKRIYHEQMDEYFRDLISQSISKIRKGRRNSSKDAAKVGKRKEISANFIDGGSGSGFRLARTFDCSLVFAFAISISIENKRNY